VFGRVKLEALFSHVTEVKLESDNCILQESNPTVTEKKDTDHTVVPPTPIH
jgi:hypothetical protein